MTAYILRASHLLELALSDASVKDTLDSSLQKWIDLLFTAGLLGGARLDIAVDGFGYHNVKNKKHATKTRSKGTHTLLSQYILLTHGYESRSGTRFPTQVRKRGPRRIPLGSSKPC